MNLKRGGDWKRLHFFKYIIYYLNSAYQLKMSLLCKRVCLSYTYALYMYEYTFTGRLHGRFSCSIILSRKSITRKLSQSHADTHTPNIQISAYTHTFTHAHTNTVSSSVYGYSPTNMLQDSHRAIHYE